MVATTDVAGGSAAGALCHSPVPPWAAAAAAVFP